MIVRSWKAKSLPGNVDAYTRHLRASVLPALRLIPGHKGAYLLKKGAGASVDLVVLTLWDSMEAIRSFAGNSVEEAVVEPTAQAVLETFDRSEDHYEVVLFSVGPVAPVP